MRAVLACSRRWIVHGDKCSRPKPNFTVSFTRKKHTVTSQSAPSPPEPNVVCPNGPEELHRGLFVCVLL